jgi:hypothetical protein
MVVETLAPPATIADAFIAIAHRVIWCTLATVDRRGRPRSRIVHPIWERTGDGLVGWLTSRPTPLRRAHLAANPYVSAPTGIPRTTSRSRSAAPRVTDPAAREHAWACFRAAPPPLGHDPATIWAAGLEDPDAGVIRLDPWRLRAAAAATLASGEPARVWRS